MAKYRFVHLSDIHFKDDANVAYNDVRSQLVSNCSQMKDKLGSADGILLTGDTVYSGKKEEFDEIAEWLEHLCNTVNCKKIAVNIVPGNHDVDHDEISRQTEILHDKLRSTNIDKIDDELDAFAETKEEGNPLLPKITAYQKFAAGFECDFESVAKPTWQKTYKMRASNVLNIIGLNSVQVSDKKDAKDKMILGRNQYTLDLDENCECLVMLHHPIYWLKDHVNVKKYLKRARVLMVGHEHSSEIDKIISIDGVEQLVIYAGAINPPENGGIYVYRYNWLEFEQQTIEGKEYLVVSVYPQVWNPYGTKFVPDTARLEGAESKEFLIACPNFSSEVPKEKDRDIKDKPENKKSDNCPGETTTQEDITMNEVDLEKYAKLRYYFWRYLDWSDRLKILVELDLLPSALSQPVPQTLEKLALEKARKLGKLKELWQAIMEIVPVEKHEDNPFL